MNVGLGAKLKYSTLLLLSLAETSVRRALDACGIWTRVREASSVRVKRAHHPRPPHRTLRHTPTLHSSRRQVLPHPKHQNNPGCFSHGVAVRMASMLAAGDRAGDGSENVSNSDRPGFLPNSSGSMIVDGDGESLLLKEIWNAQIERKKMQQWIARLECAITGSSCRQSSNTTDLVPRLQRLLQLLKRKSAEQGESKSEGASSLESAFKSYTLRQNLRENRRPEWAPDSSTDRCTRCQNVFTFWQRRHHCRACGQLFDDMCSSDRIRIPNLGYEKPVRVCLDCLPQIVNVCTSTHAPTKHSSDVVQNAQTFAEKTPVEEAVPTAPYPIPTQSAQDFKEDGEVAEAHASDAVGGPFELPAPRTPKRNMLSELSNRMKSRNAVPEILKSKGDVRDTTAKIDLKVRIDTPPSQDIKMEGENRPPARKNYFDELQKSMRKRRQSIQQEGGSPVLRAKQQKLEESYLRRRLLRARAHEQQAIENLSVNCALESFFTKSARKTAYTDNLTPRSNDSGWSTPS